MDKRTKVISSIFGLVVCYGLYTSVIGPKVVQPMFSISDEIKELEEEKAEFEKKERETRDALRRYTEFCNRNGEFRIDQIEYDFRVAVEALISDHKLSEQKVTPTETRYTKLKGIGRKKIVLEQKKVTIEATGTVENSIKFMKALSELPQVMRVLNTKITPVRERGKRRKRDKTERVAINIPIELMMVPRHPVAKKVTKESLEKRAEFVRHENRDYSNIWKKNAFTQYIVYPPLKIRVTQKDMKATEGKSFTLEASATGGDSDFEFLWEGPDLKKPKSKRTTVTPVGTGKRKYVCVVTDGQGETDRIEVMVEVSEKPKPRRSNEPKKRVVDKKPKEKPYPRRDNDNTRKRVVMTMTSRTGDQRDYEVMIDDEKKKETIYLSIGDPLDGGQLVYIHTSGILVQHTMDKEGSVDYYAYPLGHRLADGKLAVDLTENPKLQWAADWFREKMKGRVAAVATEQAGGSNGQPVTDGQPQQEESTGTPGKANEPKGKPNNPSNRRQSNTGSQPDTGKEAGAAKQQPTSNTPAETQTAPGATRTRTTPAAQRNQRSSGQRNEDAAKNRTNRRRSNPRNRAREHVRPRSGDGDSRPNEIRGGKKTAPKGKKRTARQRNNSGGKNSGSNKSP